MRAAFSVLAVIFLIAAVPRAHEVSAQSIPSPYAYVEERQEVGVFAGYMDAKTGQFGYGPSGGAWAGGRYGIELSGPLSLEGVVGAVVGTRDVISPGRPAGDRKIGEADVIITTMDVRLKFSLVGRRSWHRFSPFLLTGAGVAFDVAGSAPIEATLERDEVFDFGTSFFGTFGAGTRVFLTRRMALRLDGIFSLWKIDTPVGYTDPEYGFGALQEGEWVRGLSLTASLLYRG
jgi:hypothetical protein